MDVIPHSRPTLGGKEAKAVSAVIRSARIAQGEKVKALEEAFSSFLRVSQAACTSSGTSALYLVLAAMGVGPGHEVIIPSYVCAALLHAVRLAGAAAVPADIDPNTYNLDPEDVRRKISKKTRAIIAVHLFGMTADMDALLSLGIPIIEDCAQAVGGTRDGRLAGTMGRAAVFSFYATKVMTTAEGGMVVSDSRALVEKIKDLREYDKKKDCTPRFNYKMTDVHAAIGLVQLRRLEGFIAKRRIIAGFYRRAFDGTRLGLPPNDPGHIYFRYVLGLNRDAGPVIRALREKGIECARPIYRPIHDCMGLKGYPESQTAWRRSLSIPIYPTLRRADIDRIIAAVRSLPGARRKD